MLAASSRGVPLRCLCFVLYFCMAVCLVTPAPTGGGRGGVAPSKTWPFLGADTFLSAAIAPTAETASTAERGEVNTENVDGNVTGPSSTDFQEFVRRRKSSGGRVLLDLRPQRDFIRGHLVGATSIPADELEPRLLELPPPFAQPVNIVGNDEERRAARELLIRKGWQIDGEINSDVEITCSHSWRLDTEVGSRSAQSWRANDFLEFCMERYVLPLASERGNRLGPALDLGCGSGRDTVYMAQHLPPGARVVGVDNHSYALERGARLAEQWIDAAKESGNDTGRQNGATVLSEKGSSSSSGVAQRAGDKRRTCEWLLADLRKPGSLNGLKADIVHGHRFKCEQLLPILRDHVLMPGGLFIWSTFLDTGTDNIVPPWRPSRMLRPGELANIFSGDGFEILQDELGELQTRGSAVPANFFACRKRSHFRPPSSYDKYY